MAKPNEKLKLQCEYCKEIFLVEKRFITYELKHIRGKYKYCSLACSNRARNKKIKCKCEHCAKEIEVAQNQYNKSKSKHFFCSKSCSAQYNNKTRTPPTQETKDKIRVSLIDAYNHKKKIRICKICGKEYTWGKNDGSTKSFCSKECAETYHKHPSNYWSDESKKKLNKGGLHSAQVQKEVRRSKNEMYFCALCESSFKDVMHNEPIFNGWDADIILPNEKYAILWNGKWHYEKLTQKHSIIQTQNRDKIKVNEIVKCGYKPYIIKDLGKYNKAFVEEEFEKFKIFLKKSS